MLKLVSNKGGVELHTLQIENGVATIEPFFAGIQELLSGLTDKQQILNALSGFNPEYVWAVTYDSDFSFVQPSDEYSLSVVNIISDEHREAVNQVAALYGCGENNLGVRLIGADGLIYWGCHSWWKPEDYELFTDEKLRAQIIPAELLPSLKFLYERIVLDGDAQENWQAALSELSLTLTQEGVV